MNNSYCKEISKVKSMEQKYIEGDLVRIKTEPNNFTPNEVVYKFVDYVAIDKVLIRTIKGIDRLVGKDRIVPTPITPEILEKNGWRTQNRWYYYLDVVEGFISYIGIDFKHKSNKGHLYVEVDGNNMVEIKYCHELQHLLFGLRLNSEMEV